MTNHVATYAVSLKLADVVGLEIDVQIRGGLADEVRELNAVMVGGQRLKLACVSTVCHPSLTGWAKTDPPTDHAIETWRAYHADHVGQLERYMDAVAERFGFVRIGLAGDDKKGATK